LKRSSRDIPSIATAHTLVALIVIFCWEQDGVVLFLQASRRPLLSADCLTVHGLHKKLR
jgi:hypothetical protein